jgi:hypothetical protein
VDLAAVRAEAPRAVLPSASILAKTRRKVRVLGGRTRPVSGSGRPPRSSSDFREQPAAQSAIAVGESRPVPACQTAHPAPEPATTHSRALTPHPAHPGTEIKLAGAVSALSRHSAAAAPESSTSSHYRRRPIRLCRSRACMLWLSRVNSGRILSRGRRVT